MSSKPLQFCLDALIQETDECILWPFSLSAGVYGSLRHQGKFQKAHRLVCILAHGPPPFEKAEATHTCAHKHCVNPGHIEWRSHQETASIQTTKRERKPSKYAQFCEDAAKSECDECILWPYGKDSHGYGVLWFMGLKQVKAHNLVCRLAHGDPPTPQHVAAHNCRNRHCVNPKCLSWKTVKENSADMVRDGTAPVGQNNPNSTLSDDDVAEIRRLHKIEFLTYTEISKIYGVTASHISRIIRQITRRKVD